MNMESGSLTKYLLELCREQINGEMKTSRETLTMATRELLSLFKPLGLDATKLRFTPRMTHEERFMSTVQSLRTGISERMLELEIRTRERDRLKQEYPWL